MSHEGRLQQEVFGGVARDGELGEGGEVGTLGFDARQAVDDPLGVAVHLAHDGVELAQRHTQVGHGKILPAPPAGAAWHAAVMATPSPGEHGAGDGPTRPEPVPPALTALAGRSASPEAASAILHRMADEHPEVVDRLVMGSEPTPLASVLGPRVRARATHWVGSAWWTPPPSTSSTTWTTRSPSTSRTRPPWRAPSGSSSCASRRRDLLGLDTLETVGLALGGPRPAGARRGRGTGQRRAAHRRHRHGQAGRTRAQLQQRRRHPLRHRGRARRGRGATHLAHRTPVFPGRRRPPARGAGGAAHEVPRELQRLLGALGRDMGVPGAVEGARRGRRRRARDDGSSAPRSNRCGEGTTARTSWRRCGR